MYPSLKDVRSRPDRAVADGRRWWRPDVSGNVVGLGFTSMFTDISSEMVNAIVPLFVTMQLGFSQFQVGMFAGLHQAIAVFAALATAGMADRSRRYKEVAGAGYAVSAATKLGLLAVRSNWLPATALFYTDRVAKGVRTAPRDALISLSAVPGRLGEAFGVHRTLDTLGALLGPFLAFVILTLAPGDFGTVFIVSFWVGVIGVSVMVLFVHNGMERPDRPIAGTTSASAFHVLRLPHFRRLVLAGTAMSLVTVSDVLLYLTFQQRSDMTPRFFPLLYVGTAVSYVVLALPLGRLADRIPPARVMLAGQALLIPVDLILLRSDLGPLALFAMLGLFGAYFAATDGVLATIASSILPGASRARGLAVLNASMTASKLVAALAYGWLWQKLGSTFVLTVFLGGVVAALAMSTVLLRPLLRRNDGLQAGLERRE